MRALPHRPCHGPRPTATFAGLCILNMIFEKGISVEEKSLYGTKFYDALATIIAYKGGTWARGIVSDRGSDRRAGNAMVPWRANEIETSKGVVEWWL